MSHARRGAKRVKKSTQALLYIVLHFLFFNLLILHTNDHTPPDLLSK